MKKLTNKEILQRFEEVISSNESDFIYNETTNIIHLNGNFCSDELREIARVMDEIAHGTSEKTA